MILVRISCNEGQKVVGSRYIKVANSGAIEQSITVVVMSGPNRVLCTQLEEHISELKVRWAIFQTSCICNSLQPNNPRFVCRPESNRIAQALNRLTCNCFEDGQVKLKRFSTEVNKAVCVQSGKIMGCRNQKQSRARWWSCGEQNNVGLIEILAADF